MKLQNFLFALILFVSMPQLSWSQCTTNTFPSNAAPWNGTSVEVVSKQIQLSNTPIPLSGVDARLSRNFFCAKVLSTGSFEISFFFLPDPARLGFDYCSIAIKNNLTR
jgi:hypothetical protein